MQKPIDFNRKIVFNFKNLPDNEQALIREFFSNKQHGFFIEVGANEPIIGSQTYHLESELNWNGLLIEPLEHYAKLLQEQRKATVVMYACSNPENHGKTVEIVVAGGHSTLNDQPIAVDSHSQEISRVVCKTLDSILEEHNVQQNFDFISIDIEGHEMEMFKGFSLQKWKPKLVLLEDHVVNHEKHRHMTQNDYQLIMRTGLNSWYVPKSENYQLSIYAKLGFFRKYWLGLLFRKLRYKK